MCFCGKLEDWEGDFRKAVLPFLSSFYRFCTWLPAHVPKIETKTARSDSCPNHFNVKSDYLYPSMVPVFYFVYMEP